MLSEKTIRANLRNVYRRGTANQIKAGAEWYAEEQRDVELLASEYGHTREQVAAAMAHLSPKTPWARNKQMTRELIATGSTRGMSGNIERARRALISDTPIEDMNGPKTSSFAKNLVGRYETVTVDVWAYRAACPSGDVERMGKVEYRLIESAYIATAKHFGYDPAILQAIIWCIIRGKAK
jgi:hypothetical protein